MNEGKQFWLKAIAISMRIQLMSYVLLVSNGVLQICWPWLLKWYLALIWLREHIFYAIYTSIVQPTVYYATDSCNLLPNRCCSAHQPCDVTLVVVSRGQLQFQITAYNIAANFCIVRGMSGFEVIQSSVCNCWELQNLTSHKLFKSWLYYIQTHDFYVHSM